MTNAHLAVPSLEQTLELELYDGIVRFIQPISRETAQVLLTHKEHYNALEESLAEQDRLFAYVIVQLPEGRTYVNGIGSYEANIREGSVDAGSLYDAISGRAHAIVEGWLPQIKQALGSGLELKASQF